MIALLTCDNLDGFIHDEHHLEKALKDRGLAYKWVPWKQDTDWSQFTTAIVRTTWDYFDNPELFFSQLQKIEESSCRLLNSYSLMKWNAHKTYLRELSEKGLNTVPTLFSCNFSLQELGPALDSLNGEKFVFKPTVGAGAADTFLLSKSDSMDVLKVLEGREVMVQPFIKEIENGEYSLHYFAGEFSHAILKKPKPGDFRSQEEYGSHIEKVEPPSGMVEEGLKVLSKVTGDLLYSRVDFVVEGNQSLLMELELIEPALYFRYDETSASNLVDKLIDKFL